MKPTTRRKSAKRKPAAPAASKTPRPKGAKPVEAATVRALTSEERHVASLLGLSDTEYLHFRAQKDLERETVSRALSVRVRLAWVPVSLPEAESDSLALIEGQAAEIMNHALSGGTMIDRSGPYWLNRLAEFGPDAVRDAVTELLRAGRLPEGLNALSGAGESIARAFRRRALRSLLTTLNWHLSKAAAQMGIASGSPAVARMIRDLDLTDEYEKAKAKGEVSPQGRKTAT